MTEVAGEVRTPPPARRLTAKPRPHMMVGTSCRVSAYDDAPIWDIGPNAYILILTEGNDRGERYNLQYVDDIYPLTEPLIKAVKRHEKF